jgi:hypothetical protein
MALTVAQFKLRSVMPAEDVDRLEVQYPGYLDAVIADIADEIDRQLTKRYALPFTSGEEPRIYLRWISLMVTAEAYQRRGWNPASVENQLIVEGAATARTQVKEAANAVDGLFELPLRASEPAGSNVTKGAPFGYAEAGPYTWTDNQREDVNNGD